MNEDLPEYLKTVLKNAGLELPIYLVLLAFIPLDYYGYGQVQTNVILLSTLSMTSALIGYATRLNMKAKGLNLLFILLHYFGASVLLIGMLFKLQYYPGAAILLNVGMISLSISLILLFVPKIQELYLSKMKAILLRFLVLISWSLYLFVQ